jgi:hypothetical protein
MSHLLVNYQIQILMHLDLEIDMIIVIFPESHTHLNGKMAPLNQHGMAYGMLLVGGLVLNPENEVSIFFTGNGILMGKFLCNVNYHVNDLIVTFTGKQIPMKSIVNPLYPTVSLYGSGDDGYNHISVEANFGDDSAKPFKYDIKKCPGMVFDFGQTYTISILDSTKIQEVFKAF